MKKLIISLVFTITLPFSQMALAQDTEITASFSDTDITELQQNICNDSEVDGILSSNEAYETALNDALVTNSTGDYDVLTKSSYDSDDDDDDDLLASNILSTTETDDSSVTATVVEATKVDLTIMADPADPSAQDAVTNACI